MALSEDNESSNSNFDNENEGNDALDDSNRNLNKNDNQSFDYSFGWNRYSEITNGRFAMIGLLAILLIELISKKSFFSWTGILN
tara:strand:+ start:447 stop:698 length:252 start_codon:yes stop_codon:yes gene_type:complete